MNRCAGCGQAIAGAEVLYTPDGRAVCGACFARADLAATELRASGKLGLLAIAAVLAAIPFFLQTRSSSVVTRNGEVVEATTRDTVAIACGAAAALIALIALVLAIRARARTQLAGAIAVLAFAGYQLARGFGVLS
jgi:hypothetical protein